MDGIDGSGKSTIARMVKECYEGRGESVRLVTHPSTSVLGKISQKALQGKGKVIKLVATVFYILDVLNSLRLLRVVESRYQTVIFVRYLLGAAYLSEKLASVGYTFFKRLLPVPRRLLLVDIEPHIALRRITARGDRREMFEVPESLVEIRKNALLLAGPDWEVIDNSGSLDTTREMVMKVIDRWDTLRGIPRS